MLKPRRQLNSKSSDGGRLTCGPPDTGLVSRPNAAVPIRLRSGFDTPRPPGSMSIDCKIAASLGELRHPVPVFREGVGQLAVLRAVCFAPSTPQRSGLAVSTRRVFPTPQWYHSGGSDPDLRSQLLLLPPGGRSVWGTCRLPFPCGPSHSFRLRILNRSHRFDGLINIPATSSTSAFLFFFNFPRVLFFLRGSLISLPLLIRSLAEVLFFRRLGRWSQIVCFPKDCWSAFFVSLMLLQVSFISFHFSFNPDSV